MKFQALIATLAGYSALADVCVILQWLGLCTLRSDEVNKAAHSNPVSLEQFFKNLIQKVEQSEDITNAGKDDEGFYKPTRTILLRHLNLLKDLHKKPLAKPMLKSSWAYVAEHAPSEWLVPESQEDREELKSILN